MGGRAGIGRAVAFLLSNRGYAGTVANRGGRSCRHHYPHRSPWSYRRDCNSRRLVLTPAAPGSRRVYSQQVGPDRAVVGCAGIEVVGSVLELAPGGGPWRTLCPR